MSRLALSVETATSAAAPSFLVALTVPAGEMWKVQDVVATHDDGAGATLRWEIAGETGTPLIIIPAGVVAALARVHLGAVFACPFWLSPLWTVTIRADAALAGGCKLYTDSQAHKMRGIP